MIYWVHFLGIDNRGRIRWRGTGFDPKPGGLTMIAENDLRAVLAYLKNTQAYALETPPVFH